LLFQHDPTRSVENLKENAGGLCKFIPSGGTVEFTHLRHHSIEKGDGNFDHVLSKKEVSILYNGQQHRDLEHLGVH